MIVSQSITQLTVRSLTYLSLLVILPTFISITSANNYANIVLLSTLVTLAPLFDGGQAIAMTRWLATNPENQKGGNKKESGIALAMRDSMTWSLLISAIFIGIWVLYKGADPVHGLNITLVLVCMVMTALTTVANTCNRLMLTGTFTIAKATSLLAGPTLTAIVLGTLRYLQITDITYITTAFTVGASLSILLYMRKNGNQHTDAKNLFISFIEKNDFNEDKSYRYGLFASQAISILVVAKNPILIRHLCGDSVLAGFSLLSAANALIIAPAAAMQSPLLVSYSKKFGAQGSRSESFLKTITQHMLLAIAAGAFVAIVIWLLNIYFHKYINKDNQLLSADNMILILVSASIYIGSIIFGIYFAAIGSTRLINITAVIVLITDTLLIVLLSEYLKELTPFITIALSNIIALAIWKPLLHSRLKNNE